MKNKSCVLSNIVPAVICMLFIISFSVILVLNFRPLYYHDIKRLNIVEDSGIPENEIRRNYDVLISYNSIFHRGDLEFPTLAMSEEGRIHFEEVRNIFVFIQYLCIVTFIIGVPLVCMLIHRRNTAFLKLTGILTLTVPSILGILISMNWEAFFVTFHHLFFRNDYWIFDPATDPVITILPDTFFMHCAIAILVLVILFSVLSLMLSYIFSRYHSRKSS